MEYKALVFEENIMSEPLAIFLLLFSSLPSNFQPLRFSVQSLRFIAGGETVSKKEVDVCLDLLLTLCFFNKHKKHYAYNKNSLKNPLVQRYIDQARILVKNKSTTNIFYKILYFQKEKQPLKGVEILLHYLEREIYKKVRPEDLIALEFAIFLLEDVCQEELEQYTDEESLLFCDMVLRLQSIVLHRGKYANYCLNLFSPAYALLKKRGNQRALALLHLSRGCLEVMLEEQDSSALSFAKGLSIVKQIGDEDMLTQASAFLLPLYFAKGQKNEIFSCLDRIYTVEKGWPSIFLEGATSYFAGISAHHFKDRSLAIGLARFAQRRSKRLHQYAPNILWQVQLAIILFEKEEFFDQTEATLLALQTELDPDLETYMFLIVTRVLACGYCRYEKNAEAYGQMKRFVKIMHRNGLERTFFNTPWSLEMLFIFDEQGYSPLRNVDFKKELERSLSNNDPLMRGVALRIMSIKEYFRGVSKQTVTARLDNSIQCLLESNHFLQCQISKEIKKKLLHENPSSIYTTSFFYNKQDNTLRSELSDACRDAFLQLPQEQEKKFALRKFARTTLEVFSAEHLVFFRTHAQKLIYEIGYNYSQEDFYKEILFDCNPEIESAIFEQKIILQKNEKRSFLILPIPFDNNTWCLYVENNLSLNQYCNQNKTCLKKTARIIASELRNIINSFKRVRVEIFHRPDKSEVFFGNDIKPLLEQIKQAASSDAPVLLLGETGVGKEVIAEYVHSKSGKSGSFVPVHPASTPEALFESAFFGHEKGAFTGAIEQKIGFFEYAHNGTLFIDEVGEIPLELQVKLLRVLQEKTFSRVGSITSRHSHFRLIAATNKDLQKEVQAGRFRQDLYYRLCVLPFVIPPLRNRREDLLYLVDVFLQQFRKRYSKKIISLSPEIKNILTRYTWPGNVRELRNVIERGVILSTENKLRIPELIISEGPDKNTNANSHDNIVFKTAFAQTDSLPTLREFEKEYIQFVLTKTKGKIAGRGGGSEILDIKPSTLYAKLRSLGISLKAF